MEEANADHDQVQPDVGPELALIKVRRLKLHILRIQGVHGRENKAWHQAAHPDTLPLTEVMTTMRSMTSVSIENE